MKKTLHSKITNFKHIYQQVSPSENYASMLYWFSSDLFTTGKMY